ncbi:helix-turn-helix domain-containing protein [Aliifodinibius sp. S!AR15-10]|uniref:helix-turn-helix domain-containing protein n=1 Tax=Aliifodinibius sp. S!AR15-10 TaxID=2950437 RepID=UPI00285DCFDA|nr:helix-turn-helix domain-containing protein [Aliifodinibius sp. S!AR15-10]MDR8393767.1 helix-turn-helix domain-containing protein [Aliifodinibius sp. S!AR15-10]
MLDKKTSPSTSYRLFLKSLKSLLTWSGIHHSRQPIVAESEPSKNRIKLPVTVRSPRVGRVILYMEEHLNEELSLGQLAESVQLSKYQLIRRFRKEMETTPWKYLLTRRIAKAKQLLEQGMSPGQVAIETGFYDQSHLNKVFREKLGRTPKGYQEENFANRN